MDVNNPENLGGRVQISNDVIASITRIATLDVPDVTELSKGKLGVKGLFYKVPITSPVSVEIHDGVAAIDVFVIVSFGAKVRVVAGLVQESVKNAVQGMTGITVSKVNVIISGISVQKTE